MIDQVITTPNKKNEIIFVIKHNPIFDYILNF